MTERFVECVGGPCDGEKRQFVGEWWRPGTKKMKDAFQQGWAIPTPDGEFVHKGRYRYEDGAYRWIPDEAEA